MKKSLMMSAAVGALLAGPAFGADLPVKAPSYATPAPAFSWTGCYVGAHVGGGALHDSNDSLLLFGIDQGGQRGNGAIGGGQIGCNYQTGSFVFGIEGDGFWSGMKSTYSNSFFQVEATTKNKYDFDIAARFGFAVERAFIYGKAGWVWGKFDFNSQTFDGTATEGASATLNGILIGAGAEYAITNNWTAKFEYNYLNFGSQAVTTTVASVVSGTAVFSQSRSADKHIIRLGVNYKLF